jgi:hypothetical protein
MLIYDHVADTEKHTVTRGYSDTFVTKFVMTIHLATKVSGMRKISSATSTFIILKESSSAPGVQ